MPGKRKGPGKWIEGRAERILNKGDLKKRYGKDAKSVAFAIATQQGHALGKTPKKGKGPGDMYGTRSGKAEAKAKYDNPKSMRKTAEAVLQKLDKQKKDSRCWKGYEPVPGKEPYSPGSCRKIASSVFAKLAERPKKKGRCWTGYEPVPGKKPYSDGSCRKIASPVLAKIAKVEYRGETFPGYNKPKAAPSGSDKKMVVLAKKDGKVKKVSFGQKGYKHNYSESAKKSYLARSAGVKGKDDKHSANYWSRKVLWPRGEKADGTAKDKKANLSGRDNRTPFVGNTQMPTEASKAPAKKQLQESQDMAEFGPAPAQKANKDNFVKSLVDSAVKPVKIAEVLAAMKTDDPLLQYFRTKEGAKEMAHHKSAIETNHDTMLKARRVAKPKQDREPKIEADMVARGKADKEDALKRMFENYPGDKAVIS